MDKTTVAIQHVTVSYDKQTVFNDLSVTFTKNRVTAVLGRSGSGKSTILQLINGMVRPTAGEIFLFGDPLDYGAINQIRLHIGYVVQQTGLFPHLTMEENISLLGRIKKLPPGKAKERLHHLTEMAQISESYLKKFPHQLSGGEQQRVGLCRALFLDPPLLLMDEPFASLDDETKHGIYSYVKKFQQAEPRTIVLVTHDLDEASRLADDFIWLEAGCIKVQGTIDQLQTLKQSDSLEG